MFVSLFVLASLGACHRPPVTCDVRVAEFVTWANQVRAHAKHSPDIRPYEGLSLPRLDFEHPLLPAESYGREVRLGRAPYALGEERGVSLLVASGDVAMHKVVREVERLGGDVDVAVVTTAWDAHVAPPPRGLEDFWPAFDTTFPPGKKRPLHDTTAGLPPEPLRSKVVAIRKTITRNPSCPVDRSAVSDGAYADRGAHELEAWTKALRSCDCQIDLDAVRWYFQLRVRERFSFETIPLRVASAASVSPDLTLQACLDRAAPTLRQRAVQAPSLRISWQALTSACSRAD